MKSLFSLAACSLISSLAAGSAAQSSNSNAQNSNGQNPNAQYANQQMPDCCLKTGAKCCNQMTYEVYGDLLYLQPNASNLYYAVEAIPFNPNIAVPADSPNWKVFEIDPNYRFGFDVGVKALFPHSRINIELDWERLHSHDSASKTVPLVTDMIGPIFDIGPNSAAYQHAHGKARFHFDTVNLLFAKRYCFYEYIFADFYAGASFIRIKEILHAKFSSSSANTSRAIESSSTYIGAGPQLGVNFDLRLFEHFYFTGSSSVSLYMGRLKNGTHYRSTAPLLGALGNPQPNKQKTSVPHRTQVVPGFEEKLGFSYAILFGCCKLELGLGYQLQIYLDAIQSIDMTSPQVLPSLLPAGAVDTGVFAVGFERTLSNFMLTGPYFSASFDF